jgi:Mg-chelatase subunit ChlD
MISRSLTVISAFAAVLTLTGGLDRPAMAETNVLFIVDASGSMKKKLETGESRMDAAKKAMADALTAMPPEARLGLLLYGHRKAKDCTDIELASPIGADDAAAISKRIAGLRAKGETPIAESLRQAQRSFAALKGQDNRIVLVTDGIEECKGDPCAAAQELRDAGFNLKVDIVGFTLSEKQRALIQCVPDITGGQYYDAQGMTGLTAALTQVTQKAAELTTISWRSAMAAYMKPRPTTNGSRSMTAERATTYSGGGVRACDGVLTFDTFEVLIPAAAGYNLREFELLVGDEGPTGTFRSIGKFSTQNLKMMQSPYQRFTFAPVTAKFLKVVFMTDHGGGYVAAYDLRLFGQIDEAAAGAAAAAAPAGIDLLAQANGGMLWRGQRRMGKLNDGGGRRRPDGEVWAFRDDSR